MKITDKLDALGVRYEREYPLTGASTFRIGGVCALAIFPTTERQLADTLKALDADGIQSHIVGRGSNTLFYDGRIEKALVFTSKLDGVSIEVNNIVCGAGASLMQVSAMATAASLTGLEFACGIPGSIGGAVYMNAGAHGGSMADVVVESRAYDRKSGDIITVTEHGFGYRRSVYMDGSLVCLGATLSLSTGDEAQIKARVKELMSARREKQPLEYPSAGSYFKRPEGDFAGRLIEVCGLKGYGIGGAQVSEKHAGFVINRGGASFEDVIALEKHVVDTVREKTGVTLHREVEIVR